jgi:hypothetical protein
MTVGKGSTAQQQQLGSSSARSKGSVDMPGVFRKKRRKTKTKLNKILLVVCCNVTKVLADVRLASACVRIRQHTSAYVSILYRMPCRDL